MRFPFLNLLLFPKEDSKMDFLGVDLTKLVACVSSTVIAVGTLVRVFKTTPKKEIRTLLGRFLYTLFLGSREK